MLIRGLELYHWNLTECVALPAEVDSVSVQAALDAVTARHPALRCRFDRLEPRKWTQRLETVAAASWPMELVRTRDGELLDEAIDRAQRGLSLTAGPLCRAVLAEPADQSSEASLILVVHHLISDAISLRILSEDVALAYAQLAAGRELDLPASTEPVMTWAREVAALACDGRLREEAAYWSQQVSFPLSVAGLETSERQPECIRHQEVSKVLTRRLIDEVGPKNGAQFEQLLLAALACTFRDSGQRDGLSLMRETHGRHHELSELDTTRTVGWFSGQHPLSLPVGADDDVVDALECVKRQLAGIPSRGSGYAPLKYLGHELDGLSDPPIVINYFGSQAPGLGGPTGTELAGMERASANSRTNALEIVAYLSESQLHLEWHTNASVQAGRSVAVLMASLESYLCQLAAPDSRPAATLVPLTATQEGILFDVLSEERDTSRYVEHIEYKLGQELDPALFREVWAAMYRRHPILGARLRSRDGHSYLQVTPDTEPRISIHEPLDEHSATSAFSLRESVRVEDDTLMRLVLLRLADGTWRFLWTFHHLLLDGWSVALAIAEVRARYAALSVGTVARLKPTPSISAITGWIDMARANSGNHEPFWRDYLRELPAASGLAADRPAGAVVKPTVISVGLEPDRAANMSTACRAAHVTLSTLTRAALALTISTLTGRAEVVFGVTSSGRTAALENSASAIGMLMKTLPFRTDTRTGQTVGDWLTRQQELAVEMTEREDYPLSRMKVLAGVGPGQEPFDVLLLYQSFPEAERLSEPDELGFEVTALDEWTGFPLTVRLLPGEHARFDLIYDDTRLGPAEAWRFLRCFVRHVEGLSGAELTSDISELDWLTEPEATLLSQVEGVCHDRSEPGTLHSAFRRQADATPDAIALVDDRGELTYAQLDRAADAAARVVRTADATGPIGILMERDRNLIAAVLGTHRAGRPYLPLAEDLPVARLAYMVEDSGMSLMLASCAPELPAGLDCRVIDLDSELDMMSDIGSAAPTSDALGSRDLAYVMYTSGSSGQPKAVAMSHAASLERMVVAAEVLGLAPGDRVLASTPITFDISLWEFYLPLLCGATVVLASAGDQRDPIGLVSLLVRRAVTVVQSTPTGLRSLTRACESANDGLTPVAGVRLVLIGGEQLEPSVLAQTRTMFPAARLLNMYGPTEASVWATSSDCGALEMPSEIPIGLPLPNVTAYVLDDQLRRTPPGVPGEIFLGGSGLADGYLGRGGLTASRFVPDPFGVAGGRMYRSGDVGRRLADGSLVFLGRIDDQVKVRGHRVELGEVESALAGCVGVLAAAVSLVEGRLVGYVVGGSGWSQAVVRAELVARLPEYMVPSVFVQLQRLPVSLNGKLDRRALPAPDGLRPRLAAGFRDATVGVESVIAGVWCEVLGVDRVGVDDNFFELGGDSILTIQIVASLAKAGVRVSPRQLFQHQSIAELATVAQTNTVNTEPPAPHTPFSMTLSEAELAVIVAQPERNGHDRS